MFTGSVKGFLFTPSSVVNVAIDCGQIRGFYNGSSGAYSFLGIPYASPPVGRLRWMPPVPVNASNGNCWNGVYEATSFTSPCIQRNSSDVDNSGSFIGSEDCLHLNVWSPSLDTTAILPVMFWIYGGSLTNGRADAGDHGYGPTAEMARDHNVVYVSLNYRLNAFGFMSLDMLRAGSPTNTSGNYGFMDMLTGLQWVQNNIRQFGGDPNQVTIFGQSSGGTAVFALLGSPLSRGLFHKAWMSSASPIMNKTAEDANSDNQAFVRKSGCADVGCLYNLTPAEIIASLPWKEFPYWGMDDLGDFPTKGRFDGALAVVDGYVLPKSPLEAFAEGEGVDVPVLIGTTAQEVDIEHPSANWTWGDNNYREHVRDKLNPFGTVIAETALQLYPANKSTPEFQITSMISDCRAVCGNDYLGVILSAAVASPVYRYVAAYIPSGPARPFGGAVEASNAFHGIDILAYFNATRLMLTHVTDADRQWEINIQQEVLAFVRTGSPHTYDWGMFPSQTALLTENTTVTAGYHTAECLFWLRNGFFSYSWIN
ncbi:fumonisin B1 esterase-like [Mya arenaria]|uniref:fumonisin B1 esterase-like n=1 Tax=Mya arenaria TaxID=6604 RepID=UPI0022E08B73|nr:fumonisin B1 esterase-like [Mya arenaria]